MENGTILFTAPNKVEMSKLFMPKSYTIYRISYQLKYRDIKRNVVHGNSGLLSKNLRKNIDKSRGFFFRESKICEQNFTFQLLHMSGVVVLTTKSCLL